MNNQIEQIEALTQEAVRKVFHSMVSMDLSVAEPDQEPHEPVEQIIASVGFIGEATGVIHLYVDLAFAKTIASKMLGVAEADVDGDETVNDAMGELSNMVVGYVKSHIANGEVPCTLTIPSIVRGQQMSVEGSSSIKKKVLGFRDGTNQLLAEILLKDSQP
jgi:chemotaxis protein CheX